MVNLIERILNHEKTMLIWLMLIIISVVCVPTSTVMGYGGYEIFVKDSKNICIYI